MKLLIVEDEIFLRNRLASLDWTSIGLEVMGVADTGRAALSATKENSVDIILLDISLPDCNGLELARQLLDKWKWIKIVILSGYDDFQYAQHAIELEVVKYLLKPSTNQEILDAVEEAVEKLKDELQSHLTESTLTEKWTQHAPQLRTQFLQQLIKGGYERWQIDRLCRDLAIEWPASPTYIVLVADTDPILESSQRFQERDKDLLQFALHSIASEYLSDQHVFYDANGKICILIVADEGDQEVSLLHQANAASEKLLTLVQGILKMTASIGIGTVVSQPERIADSYRHAMEALLERGVYGPGLAIPYEQKQIALAKKEFSTELESRMEISLDKGNEEELWSLMHSFMEERLHKVSSASEFKEYVYYMAAVVIRITQKKEWNLQAVIGDLVSRFDRLGDFSTKEEFSEWMRKVCHRMILYIQGQRTSKSKRVLDPILELIDERLCKEINLDQIAKEMYMNSSYISRLFKREMGLSFSDYLWKRKMERAGEMLQAGMKVYVVAEQLGYNNISFFSKSFRKFWGVPPGEMKV